MCGTFVLDPQNHLSKNPIPYQMWMEWVIPIQKLEVSKIQVGSFQRTLKPLSPISYADGPIVFQSLNLLLPPLTIKEYDASSGRLVLSLTESPQTSAKLSALQESLLTLVSTHQKTWFPESNRSKEQLHQSFQPFVEPSLLHLYCPLQTPEKRHTISVWRDSSWKKLTTAGLLSKGESIRVALRLQGISYQMNTSTGAWMGRFRVQHKISCIYVCSKQRAAEEQKC
jgi:hypothetical protein